MSKKKKLTAGSLLLLALLLAIVAAGCGSSGGSSSSSSESTGATSEEESAEASGTAETEPAASEAGGGEISGPIVAFIPTKTQEYVAAWVRGAEAEAKSLGIELKLIENNFEQNEQDNQVRQFLTAGESAAGFIWWPSDAEAGHVSLSQLNEAGSVVQSNQGVTAESEGLVAAYAGVSDEENGQTTGENAVAAREALKEAGVELHSSGGNVIIVNLSTGYQAGIVRAEQIKKVVEAAGMKVTGEINAGFDAAEGYKFGSQLITKTKGEGIDVVVSMIDDLTPGVMRALKEQGLNPGKDVSVVSGTCSKGLPYIKNGEEYATGIQPGESEGELAVSTAVKAAEGGIPKYEAFFMPNESITKENIGTYELEGKSVEELCAE